MSNIYESELLYKLMERDGLNIPSSVPSYESEIKAYLIEQVKLAYPKLNDYEAEWLLYNYTKHLPAEFPIETITDVTNATVNNVVPYAYKSAILKGQTLINCVDNSKVTVTDATKDNDIYTLNKSILYSRLNFNTDQSLLQINKTYTIILKDVVGSLENIYISGNGVVRESLSTGVAKVTIISEALQNRHLWIENRLATSGEVSFKVMIIEGDYTDVDIPYFTGIQSVKMPVLTTTGKNIVDDTILKQTNLNINSNTRQIPIQLMVGDYFIGLTLSNNASPNSSYFAIRLWDKDFKMVRTFPPNTVKTISLEESAKIAYMDVYTNGQHDYGDVYIKNFWVAKSSSATPYEPYKSNILTANEDVTLRSNGNICDELNLLTGQLTQRIDEDGEVLSQEVVKTVDLSVVDENGNEIKHFMPIDGTMHIQTDGTPIKPTTTMEIPVEAINQNLASFIEMEV